MPVDSELAAILETTVDETVKEMVTEATPEKEENATTATEGTQKVGSEEAILAGTAEHLPPKDTISDEETTTDVGTTDETAGEDAKGVSTEEGGEVAGEEEKVTPPKDLKVTLPQYHISNETLTRAAQVGIPLEVAKTFQSEATLSAWIIDKERIASSPLFETKEETKDPFDELPKLDPEVYEKDVIETFDKLTGIVRQQRDQIKELTSTTQQSTEAAQGAATREIEEWFDGKIKNLGEDFSEVLGEGDVGSLAQGSSQLVKRQQLANHVATLFAGYEATGQQLPPRDQVFDTAAKLVLQDEYQKIHEKELTAKLAKRSGQHISRAGGQTAIKNQSTEDEIAAKLDKKFS